MEKSKVFFTDLHTTPSSNLLDKMERLCRRAGIAGLDFSNPFTAIKIHFGEPGNLAYIRPNYAARMANLLRSLGAKPFLTIVIPFIRDVVPMRSIIYAVLWRMVSILSRRSVM